MSEMPITPTPEDEDPTKTGTHEGDGDTPPPAGEDYYKNRRYSGDSNHLIDFWSSSPPELTSKQEREARQVDLVAEMHNNELSPKQVKELVGKLTPEASQVLLHELQMQEAVKEYLRGLIAYIGKQPKTEGWSHTTGGFKKMLDGFMSEEMGLNNIPFPLKHKPQSDTSLELKDDELEKNIFAAKLELKKKLTELGPDLINSVIDNIVEQAMFYHLGGRGESGLIDARIKPLVDITIVGAKNEVLMFNAIKEWAKKWPQLKNKKLVTSAATSVGQPKPLTTDLGSKPTDFGVGDEKVYMNDDSKGRRNF